MGGTQSASGAAAQNAGNATPSYLERLRAQTRAVDHDNLPALETNLIRYHRSVKLMSLPQPSTAALHPPVPGLCASATHACKTTEPDQIVEVTDDVFSMAWIELEPGPDEHEKELVAFGASVLIKQRRGQIEMTKPGVQSQQDDDLYLTVSKYRWQPQVSWRARSGTDSQEWLIEPYVDQSKPPPSAQDNQLIQPWLLLTGTLVTVRIKQSGHSRPFLVMQQQNGRTLLAREVKRRMWWLYPWDEVDKRPNAPLQEAASRMSDDLLLRLESLTKLFVGGVHSNNSPESSDRSRAPATADLHGDDIRESLLAQQVKELADDLNKNPDLCVCRIALFGRSGAGKSTLTKALTGDSFAATSGVLSMTQFTTGYTSPCPALEVWDTQGYDKSVEPSEWSELTDSICMAMQAHNLHLSCALFVISAKDARIFVPKDKEGIVSVLRVFAMHKLPACVVLTNKLSVDREDLNEQVALLNSVLEPFPDVRLLQVNSLAWRPAIAGNFEIPEEGLVELVEHCASTLSLPMALCFLKGVKTDLLERVRKQIGWMRYLLRRIQLTPAEKNKVRMQLERLRLQPAAYVGAAGP